MRRRVATETVGSKATSKPQIKINPAPAEYDAIRRRVEQVNDSLENQGLPRMMNATRWVQALVSKELGGTL